MTKSREKSGREMVFKFSSSPPPPWLRAVMRVGPLRLARQSKDNCGLFVQSYQESILVLGQDVLAYTFNKLGYRQGHELWRNDFKSDAG